MMRLAGAAGLLVATTIVVAHGAGLDDPVDDGEAQIWYLAHAGWLVRTSEHCLVFDYTGPAEGGSMETGGLSPEALAGCRAVMFVSHGHPDHFNRRSLELRKTVEDLTVVMGWREAGLADALVPEDGEWTNVSGAEVLVLHHEFDGIPEGFFLVRSGGVTIYHSGDHGTWSEPPNALFRANIDRLAAAVPKIDIAFLSSFGRRRGRPVLNQGDVYTLEALEARVTFPMHCGGCETRYADFAREASALGLTTKLGVADAPGAFFRYSEGALRSSP